MEPRYGYGAMPEIRSSEQKGLDLLGVYPCCFAVMSILLFLGATIKMVFLAYDENVKYWIGEWPTYVAWFPLPCIFLAFVIHWIKGQPSKVASLIGLLLPSIVLFAGAYKIGIAALTLSTAFGASDCVTSQQMYSLQVDYDAAVAFRRVCSSNWTAGSDKTLQNCHTYEAMATKNPSWAYLSFLEKSSGCGGWCRAAKPIWAYSTAVQDPCSSAAAEALGTEVLYPAMQVAVYGALLLLATTIGIAILGPKASSLGLNW